MRLFHRFLCWFPAWAFGTAIAFVAIAVGAGQVWPKAKGWDEAQWERLGTVVTAPVFWIIAVVIVAAWLCLTVLTRPKHPDRGRFHPEANMPLYRACRWIARDSVWAAKYRGSDDDWPRKVADELLSKWHLGCFEMMGHESATGPLGNIPPAMKQNSQFQAHKLSTDEPPVIIWGSPNGLTDRCFYDVKLDYRDVRQTWPKRSLLSKLRRKSPVERIDYADLFRRQDEWYN